MRSLTVLLISLYITSGAWADDPAPAAAEADAAQSAVPATATDESSTPTAEVPTSATATQSAPAADAPSETKAEKAAIDPVALKKAGYRLVNENGQQLYCREDLSTGSHLKKTKTCLTERELDQLMTNTRREIEYMRMRVPPPQGK